MFRGVGGELPCLVIGVVPPPPIREVRLWVGAAWCGAFCHSVEEASRDQITDRPKLELPQYVADQENQGPATVREWVTLPPTEGTRKSGWKVCQKDGEQR